MVGLCREETLYVCLLVWEVDGRWGAGMSGGFGGIRGECMCLCVVVGGSLSLSGGGL